MKENRILVTGSGGIGGVNFVRAIRGAEELSKQKFFIVGTDFNPFHILFPEIDVRIRTPRHSDPNFLKKIKDAIKSYRIQFLHPHPSVEARVIAEHAEEIEKLGAKLYLPNPSSIAPDKFQIFKRLHAANVPVPRTVRIEKLEDIARGFEELGSPLWLRAVRGAGGRLSLLVKKPEEAEMWIRLNASQGRASISDFILQEYLPGRDLAFDSLWYNGELVTSYVRERLEYPFKHISLTGITGTPSVAKTLHYDEASKIGEKAVKALDPNPHGFFSVDLKEDENGKPKVTEVDGKWHTTAPLWGYAFMKLRKKLTYNLAYLYLTLGIHGNLEELQEKPPKYNLFPEDFYLVRQMDCGVLLVDKNMNKTKIT
ncbi:MAG: hypothetical protein DRJ46_02255 [Thermoprotei archaeon]|nr:MAG: hypothetical protein DRJ46_02255 [Thermoprotei archaeon]